MIELKHSCTIIHDYELGECPVLENLLSVWEKAIFAYSWHNFLYDEDERKLTIPRGLDVNYLRYLFPDKKLSVNKKADDTKTAIFRCTENPRDDNQIKAIQYLLSEGEYGNLGEYSQRMLCLKTGGGKTYCTINALSHFRKRVMVIVDQDRIMQQWKDEFLKFTNLNEKEIYLISGSSTINKIMKSKSDLPYKVYIASHRTISSYAGDDWTKVTDFFNKIKIGAKVFDEAHVEFKNTFMIDSHTNTSNTIYLTATPNRSNHIEDKVYQQMFKMIPKHGIEQKNDNPYHYLYYISYDSKPSTTMVAKCVRSRSNRV